MDAHKGNDFINVIKSNSGKGAATVDDACDEQQISIPPKSPCCPMSMEPNGKGKVETSQDPSMKLLAHAVKDVNKKFAQLNDMVKQNLQNITHMDNTKDKKPEHISSTKCSGGPTSVELDDCPRIDSTPMSKKSKTNSNGKSKSKPLACSSKMNMTPRLGHIETVVLVSSDDELLPKDSEPILQPPRAQKVESKTNTRTTKGHGSNAPKAKVKTEVDDAATVVKLEKVDDEFCNSPLPRRSQRSKATHSTTMEGIASKVSQNASTGKRPKKIAKMTNTSSLVEGRKDCNMQDASSMMKTNNVRKAQGHMLPKNALCQFPPTPEMGLSKEEAQVCAYAFHPNMDPRYVLKLIAWKIMTIYVPIEDLNGYWYLMVISIRDQKIYYLDSHKRIESLVVERKAESISGMIAIGNYNDQFLSGMRDFNKWPIAEPKGLPNPADCCMGIKLVGYGLCFPTKCVPFAQKYCLTYTFPSPE
ncbi:Papain-like cysteine peptidase superfamily [Sesbania bispinosa]|nr:Papain-like cysteine peptidase superfamily [Sesbania bispinosa]